MAEYHYVKTGKLKLKGQKDSSAKALKRGKHKRKKSEADPTPSDPEAVMFGNWWKVVDYEGIRDRMFLEVFGNVCIFAEDTGKFSLQPCGNDGPQPEQVFSIVKSGDTKISLKSGYGEPSKQLIHFKVGLSMCRCLTDSLA
jgi:protein FRG1